MEYVFDQTGMPQQILDLHRAQSGDPASSWLFGTFWDRTIGAVAEPGFFLDSLLTSEWDAIVFFDQTNPSALLPFPFAVTNSSLPNEAVGVTYLQDLVSTYSPGPTWTVVGGALPPGLSLKPGGLLTGIPEYLRPAEPIISPSVPERARQQRPPSFKSAFRIRAADPLARNKCGTRRLCLPFFGAASA